MRLNRPGTPLASDQNLISSLGYKSTSFQNYFNTSETLFLKSLGLYYHTNAYVRLRYDNLPVYI